MAIKYELIAEVKREGNRFVPYEIKTNTRVTETVAFLTRQRAFQRDNYIGRVTSASGNVYWRRLKKNAVPSEYVSPFSMEGGSTASSDIMPPSQSATSTNVKEVSYDGVSVPSDDEVRAKISTCMSLKPDTLVIDDLNWKLAVRGALRGENILLLGHSGCGKTLTARTLASSLNRPFFRFNMGAMQDARASLIGNTHYAVDKGTFFAGSEFVKAISTPFAVILLDEYTRISPDAENIMLMPLDRDQRYLRIDEDPNTPTIPVAPGVTFIATANVGTEYTSTRMLDRATKDRWSTIVELAVLNKDQEVSLAKKLFPDLNRNYIDAIADVAAYTRDNVNSDNPTLSTIVSTRSVHEQCKLALDGFRFSEVMEAIVFQLFDPEGGVGDSERSEVRQKAQEKSHLDNESPLIFETKAKKGASSDADDKPNTPKKNLFDTDEDAL